jgi:glycosyltransferase involved in cell wall biosynthesis
MKLPDRRDGVSVVLIVRNGADYVGEAIASVRRSRRQPLEIIVVDGGSTDHTCHIAAREPLVRVLPQQSRGIPGAYNEGIAASRGELVAFISHDDLWEPGKLDVQADLMLQRPELDLTVTMVQHFLAEGAGVPAGFRPELLEQAVPGMIMEALMVRPRVFERVGGFDPAFTAGEDTDWFARVRDAGLPMAVIPQTLVRKRVHATNFSINAPALNAHLLRALRGSIGRKRQGAPAAGADPARGP